MALQEYLLATIDLNSLEMNYNDHVKSHKLNIASDRSITHKQTTKSV